MACLLLPAETASDGSVVLERLPVGTLPQDVLQQGQVYQAFVSSDARLVWQHSPQACCHNLAASSLVRTQVNGDAVLVLREQAGCGQQHILLERLMTQHLPRSTRWQLDPCLIEAVAADIQPAGARIQGKAPSKATRSSRRKRSLELQHAMLHRLLRRPPWAERRQPGQPLPLGGQQPPPAAGLPQAPVTPLREQHGCTAAHCTHPQSPGLNVCHQQHGQMPARSGEAAIHSGAAEGRPPPASVPAPEQVPVGHAGQHGVQVYDCEPRQQLLWNIAGKATSLSWQRSAPAQGAAEPPSCHTEQCITAGAAGSSTATGASIAVHTSVEGKESTPPQAGQQAPGEAKAAAPQPFTTLHRCYSERSRWAELQPEILAAVLAQAGHGARTATTLSQVCASWRQSIGSERSALRRLRLTRLSWQAAAPEPGSNREHAASGSINTAPASSLDSTCVLLPWLVEQAVKAGNVAAAVLAARHWEEQDEVPGGSSPADVHMAGTASGGGAGQHPVGRRRQLGHTALAARSQAARYWARAAKAGHPEAQWKLGYGYYKGLMGLPRDSEDALLWLSRAARQLEELMAARQPAPPAAAAGQPARGSASCRPHSVAVADAQLPALMTPSNCQSVLAQAALVLAYMALDGEACKPDIATAVRWLRMAAQHGCREAPRVLGSLYNTGMFG